MSELAAAYGSSVKDIGSANPQTQERKQEHQINVGEELKIPITKQADNLESAPNTLDVAEVKPTEQGDLESQVKQQIESGKPIDVDSKDAFKQVLTVYRLFRTGQLEGNKYKAGDLFKGGSSDMRQTHTKAFEYNGTTFKLIYNPKESFKVIGTSSTTRYTDKQGQTADPELNLIGPNVNEAFGRGSYVSKVAKMRIPGTIDKNDQKNWGNVVQYVKGNISFNQMMKR